MTDRSEQEEQSTHAAAYHPTSPGRHRQELTILQAVAELALTLAELEREYILTVLRRVGHNRTHAAAALGIPRRTLYRRLAEYAN